MHVRPVRPDDRARWAILRQLLWPDTSGEDHAAEQAAILADPNACVALVADTGNGDLAGLVEVSVHAQVDGCSTRPVGYVEGWYVLPEHRRSGLGRRLIAAAEDWARDRGCREMASDALADNGVGLAAHRAIGFHEMHRIVMFRKRIGGS